MVKNNLTVDFTDDEGTNVLSYIVKKANVAAKARSIRLSKAIQESDKTEDEKGILFSCLALASSLHNKDGELAFPDDDAPEAIMNTMDAEVFDVLIMSHLEVNPIEPSLTAKKKRS